LRRNKKSLTIEIPNGNGFKKTSQLKAARRLKRGQRKEEKES
jgi:hypothetical protein